jgi:uncharacterized membrane protein YgdD (TMEM256/DUF423 family)
MSGTAELGLIAALGIMVIAVLGQRNKRRPLRGRAAQIVSGAVLTIGVVAAVGALVIVALLIASR